jgi:hypothetical protein
VVSFADRHWRSTEVRVRHPTITHEVTVLQLRKWSESTAVTPDERVRKDRVRTMLG